MYNVCTISVCLYTHIHVAPATYPPRVRAVYKGSNFITFVWNELPCRHENGAIVGYRVAYSSCCDEKGMPIRKSYDTRYTRFNATHLKPDTIVTFQVAAVNIVGRGDFSPPLKVKTGPAG